MAEILAKCVRMRDASQRSCSLEGQEAAGATFMDASGQMGYLIYFLLYVAVGPFLVGGAIWFLAARKFGVRVFGRLLWGAVGGGTVIGVPVASAVIMEGLDMASIIAGLFFTGLALVLVWFFLLFLENRVGSQLP